MLNIYKYKVEWCPICNQGWVEIVKEASTSELYVLCDECSVEWKTPMDVRNANLATLNTHGRSIEPTDEEIINQGWEKFILRD